MDPAFLVNLNCQPVNPVMVFLKAVIAQFIFNPETNHHHANHTNCKPDSIDDGIGPVFPEVTYGDFQQIFNHAKFRDNPGYTCKIIIKYTISITNLLIIIKYLNLRWKGQLNSVIPDGVGLSDPRWFYNMTDPLFHS